MSRFCCPGYVPSTAKITVWMPRPCQLKYKSENDKFWKVIEGCGLTYTTEKLVANTCNKTYQARVQLTGYDWQDELKTVQSNMQFTGEFVSIVPIGAGYSGNFLGVQIWAKSCQGNLQFFDITMDIYIHTFSQDKLDTATATLLNIYNPDPEEQQRCKLSVKNKNGVEVLSTISDKCPKVQYEKCKVDPNNKQIFCVPLEIKTAWVGIPPGVRKECILIEKNNNQLSLFKAYYRMWEGAVPFLLTTDHLVTYTSPDGCDAPTYMIECDGCDSLDDGCKQCPPGTTALECGDNICCYNPNNCQLVYSFPKSERC